jgi:hypothetical protein
MHALLSRLVATRRSGGEHVPLGYLGRLVRAFQPV